MDPGITAVFKFLEAIGFVDVVLPLILAFAIVYGILDKTKILGTESGEAKKNINAIVAFVIAFIVVMSINMVRLMTNIIWIFTTVIVMAIMLMLIMAVFGVKPSEIFKKRKKNED